MGNRHRAREFVLQLLYSLDFNDSSRTASLAYFWNGVKVSEEIRKFADSLLDGILANKDRIDKVLEKYSENWSLDRMSGVDRNILRMSIYEILFLPEIPPNVTINEAVEIGKKFGAEDSGAFINGILDKISKDFQEKKI